MSTIQTTTGGLGYLPRLRVLFFDLPRFRLGLASVSVSVAFALVACLPRSAVAHTPESPEVKSMVERGLAFLVKNTPLPESSALNDDTGALWLAALTLIKSGKDESHPLVAAAVKRAQQAAQANAPRAPGAVGIYAHALSIIFLCELEPVRYKGEISILLTALLRIQQPGGGWSYPDGGVGDTSQTQYGVLAMWTADHAGFDVPTENIERACHWLLRTQSVTGGFGYQPTDPPGGARIVQGGESLSLSAAGLGSTYICGDLLSASHGKDDAKGAGDGLPSALRLVAEETSKQPGRKRRTTKLDVAALRRCQAEGDAWFAKNFKVDPVEWTFYYLYGYERYQSFRELAAGKIEPEPAWYNTVVDFLKAKQGGDGSWTGGHSADSSTAFAILVLIRSTKKSIAKVVITEGALAGGRGLPTDVTNVKLKGNQVVGVSATKSIDELLDLLEGTNDAAVETALENGTQTTLGADATTRAKQAERLRKIVSLPNYQARILAVKTLAAERDLENVPVLIYALGDPDWRVAKEAQDGLRRISRRFDGFNLPEQPTYAQRASAQQSWKQWYLSIKPEAEFIE